MALVAKYLVILATNKNDIRLGFRFLKYLTKARLSFKSCFKIEFLLQLFISSYSLANPSFAHTRQLSIFRFRS